MKLTSFPWQGSKLMLAAIFATSAITSLHAQAPRRFRHNTEIENALGNRVASTAQSLGLAEKDFREVVRHDHGMRCDEAGALHYCCQGLIPAGVGRVRTTLGTASTATTGSSIIPAANYPTSQTFLLHSRPTSTKKIYLDFDGHTTTGTSWNSTYTAGGSITTPAFNIDSTTGFSDTELLRIQMIWRRVVEDFAAFNVDVTTEDPGLEGLRRSTSTDQAYGVRVCIGGSSSDWFGAAAGGVAYIGSFNWNSDTPCFVFTTQLGGGNEKYTAEATSHEVGHTLGLTHDGQTNGTEYYSGHGNWAPIMGVGYYSEVVQWSKGEYSLANNKQDDLTVMQSYGALPIADEHGNSITTASVLSGSSVSAEGLITSRTDMDVFRFTTGAGSVSFNAATATPSPNLDVLLALYDGAGTLITSSNPAGLPGSLTTTLTAGTYYLAVDGTGTGDPTTAYNDYGSIGQYLLTGTVIPAGNQPPVVSIASSAPITGPSPLTVNFSSNGTYDPDGTIASYDWDFGDGTPHVTTANASHQYTTPGTFTASLVAFDNGGLSSSATLSITVTQTLQIYVANIAMSMNTNKKGTTATATVTVKNQNGALVSGARVNGSWSGLYAGNVSGTTNTSGVAALSTARVRGSGSFIFTVTGITISGSTYTPSLNVETTDSITVP